MSVPTVLTVLKRLLGIIGGLYKDRHTRGLKHFNFLFWFFFLFVLLLPFPSPSLEGRVGVGLSYERNPERVFDTLAFGMGGGKFLRRAFEVSTHVFELRCYLLLERELLHVNSVVGVGGDGRVGVLLPRERFRPADDDLETVVLDSAGEGPWQSAFSDQRLYCFLYLRTERFEGFFGLIACYLRSEKLVDNFVV